jgi:hypothetical protein
MISCEGTNFKFPMLADIYHPTIQQSAYGGIAKTWTIDRTVAGNFIRAGAETKEELIVNIDLTQDSLLIARVRSDMRFAEDGDPNALTSVLVTNIRDINNNVLYFETAGPRSAGPTIYEIATQQPFINPFGRIEHYTIVLRRSENQGVLG